MIHPRVLLFALAVLFALGFLQMAVFYPRMPATMASHFGSGGQADDWMPKSAFFSLMGGIHVAVAPVLLAIAYAIKYVPMRFINIPRKEYWADPEHEDEARDYLFCDMLWFGCATVALVDAIMYLSFRANLRPDHSMGYWPWVVIGVYTVWTAGWAVRMIWRFHRIPKEEEGEEAAGRAGREATG